MATQVVSVKIYPYNDGDGPSNLLLNLALLPEGHKIRKAVEESIANTTPNRVYVARMEAADFDDEDIYDEHFDNAVVPTPCTVEITNSAIIAEHGA